MPGRVAVSVIQPLTAGRKSNASSRQQVELLFGHWLLAKKAPPPGPGRAEIEAHLLLQCRQVEPDEVGEPALQHEIRHAARELRGLVRIPAKADRQIAS